MNKEWDTKVRGYDRRAITLAEFLQRWRKATAKEMYVLSSDFPALAVWLVKDPMEFMEKTFGHLRALTLNKRVREWSGVAPKQIRGSAYKKKAETYAEAVRRGPVEAEPVLPDAQAGQQEEARQQPEPEPFNPETSPGMTDLMVTPESVQESVEPTITPGEEGEDVAKKKSKDLKTEGEGGKVKTKKNDEQDLDAMLLEIEHEEANGPEEPEEE